MRDNHGRIQGRRGVALRKRRLFNEPICRHCAAKGLTTLATTPDHIIPLSQGGTDTDDNIQCLCQPCHDIKTATEQAHLGASNHPDWLEPSAIPLTIVCGPPASGKSTYVDQCAKPNDTIICLDTIMGEISPSFRQWQERPDRMLFNAAIRERNRRLGSLSKATTGRAWFIVSAPTKAERDWWQAKLGGEVVLINPGADECKRRAMARGTPLAAAGVNRWFHRAKQPWQRRTAKVRPVIGQDGWPE